MPAAAQKGLAVLAISILKLASFWNISDGEMLFTNELEILHQKHHVLFLKLIFFNYIRSRQCNTNMLQMSAQLLWGNEYDFFVLLRPTDKYHFG